MSPSNGATSPASRPAGKRMTKYAYRLETTRIREPLFPYAGTALNESGEAVRFVLSLDKADRETFLAVYLNTANKVVGLHTQKGTVNQSAVYPREVIKHALLCGADAMIIAHNHPGGTARPSLEDKRITEVIQEAAKLFNIRFLDHILIAEGTGYSFSEMGWMP